MRLLPDGDVISALILQRRVVLQICTHVHQTSPQQDDLRVLSFPASEQTHFWVRLRHALTLVWMTLFAKCENVYVFCKRGEATVTP